MSTLLFSTDSAFDETFDEILMSMLSWPAGMPGIAIAAQWGFWITENDWLATMFVTSYGPTPGGGLVGWAVIGVPVGMMPSAGNASTLSNGPYGRRQVDHDLAGGVVGRDSADRLRLASRECRRAHDHGRDETT